MHLGISDVYLNIRSFSNIATVYIIRSIQNEGEFRILVVPLGNSLGELGSPGETGFPLEKHVAGGVGGAVCCPGIWNFSPYQLAINHISSDRCKLRQTNIPPIGAI